jgi:osmoprotectant transport system permease protein
VAKGGVVVIGEPHMPLAFLGEVGQAFDFIVHGQQAETANIHVGGPHQVLELAWTQLKLTGLAMTLALVIALPAGLVLGHYGKGELFAVSLGNAGRAIPELVIIALMATVIGVGLGNVTIALAILAVPPILTNTFVAVRQVDRGAIDAARGMGMTTAGLITKVELPLAVPTIMGGVRTSTINVVATATIAPLAGVLTLGDFIISRNVYGDDGVLAGAICVALLALGLELALAGLQRRLTSPGIRLQQSPA